MTRPDLRLLGPAATLWAAAAAAPVVPPAVASAVAGCFAVLGLVALSARGRPGAALVAALCLTTAGGLLASAGRVAAREAGALPALARQEAAVGAVAVLTDDPRLSRAGTSWYVTARIERLTHERTSWTLRQPVLMLARDRSWSGLLPGQRVAVEGRLAAAQRDDTVSALLLVNGTTRLIGGPGPVALAAGRVRAGLRQAAQGLPGASAGLLPGLVDGDTSALPAAVRDDFQATGLTHVVAVSGANCVAVLAAAAAVTRVIGLRSRAGAVLAGFALAAFVVLVRPSPSVLRAAVTGFLALAAVATGRDALAVPVLSATVIVLVAFGPDLARQAGFALSVLATAGLLLLAPGWRDRLVRRGWPRWAAEAVAVPAAAQAACAPVLAVLGAGLGPVSVPANLLALPAVPWATVTGVVAAVSGAWCPPLARAAAWTAYPACWWLVTVARVGARVPGARTPWPDGLAGGVLLAVLLPLTLALVRRREGRRIALGVVVVLLPAALLLAAGRGGVTPG